MPHSGKHGLVPNFWDVLMPWNLKSTYFSLKMIHFLSLNIWYVIYVVFWIKYWNLKLPHHCILFLFTICTVSQLFWNRVCRFKEYILKGLSILISHSRDISCQQGAMKSFKGGMQDRNVGPLLPDDFFLLTFNKNWKKRNKYKKFK